MTLETTKFDVQDFLKTPEQLAAYIEAALETGDTAFIKAAIGDIVRAQGATAFAKKAGLSREALYKAFEPKGNPTLETLTKTTKALGLRLSVKAA